MSRTKPAVAFGLLLLGMALVSLSVLRQLYQFALSEESASHVLLIPWVTAILVFQRRDDIFRTVHQEYRAGTIVMAAGMIIWIAVRLFAPALSPVEQLSGTVAGLVVGVLGAFILCFGLTAFRTALFPLLFLIAAVPIPEQLLAVFVYVLKSGSSDAVAALFELTGTPNHREGFVFSLATLTIVVADECSGIRSSIALVLTSLLAGYTFLDRPWTRTILVLLVLPMAIVKNAIRIVTLSLLAIHVDPAFITGRLHHDGGVVFFILAAALMLPWLAILRRFETPRPAAVKQEAIA